MQQNQNHEILHFSDIKDVGISYCNSPSTYPEHWHLSAEFILALKDNSHYMVSNTQYILNSGDILFIWPTEIHSVIDTPKNSSLILQFSSEIISHFNDINQISNMLKTCHLLRKGEDYLYNVIFEKMNDCYKLYNSEELFIETRIKLLIIEMLYMISRNVITNKKATLPENNSYRYYRIQEACEYIIENCTRNLSQKEVAGYVNFSVYYFSRIFKEYTKESFSDFLTKQRLEHAVRLLGANDISITEIAFLSGFQSISNFNKTFLKAKGCSPKQYRKMLHNNN